MTLEKAREQMAQLQRSLYALRHAACVLSTDGDTVAPKQSWKGRGEALGYLGELEYKALVNDETGEMLETLLANRDALDEKTLRQAELLKEGYDDMHLLPMEEYVEWQKLTSESSAVWHEAKEKSDYAMFAPVLERLISFRRRFAELKARGEKKPYDALLDEYEKGACQETLDPFFKSIREDLSPLILEIAKQPAIGFDYTKFTWPREDQYRFSLELMRMESIDPERCVLGETEHPFTNGANKWDVRITTNYSEDNPFDSMFSVIHEGGHALYEMGVADDLQFTNLGGGATMGIHESQSRFFENLICRNRAFMEPLLETMKKYFPEQMKGVTPDILYKTVNLSKPSLIRTEADELTYPLHVMIRYEIEKAIFSGQLTVKELPGVWNDMYKQYLGVDVPDDRRGVLQDSHWSFGGFGYFPSYVLGSAYGVQMLNQMEKDLDVWAVVKTGNLGPVNAWLDEKVHKFGSLKKPQDILLNAMGAPLDPKVYTGYLTAKYKDLYNL